MRANKLKTAWIAIASVAFVFHTCFSAICKRMTNSVTRPWVDKMIQEWAHRMLNVIHAKCVVINPHQVKPKKGVPTIIMCNHSSLYDIPISMKAFPNTSLRMLAKKELSKIPVMAGGMHAAEFPFVDRKNRQQAIKDLAAIQELLESGIVLWVAPEGTRSKTGKLGPFKKGAFITAIHAKATIIPIGIRGANDILPAKSFAINTHQTAEVHVGDPIDASAYTLDTKQELIDKVHQTMLKLTGEA